MTFQIGSSDGTKPHVRPGSPEDSGSKSCLTDQEVQQVVSTTLTDMSKQNAHEMPQDRPAFSNVQNGKLPKAKRLSLLGRISASVSGVKGCFSNTVTIICSIFSKCLGFISSPNDDSPRRDAEVNFKLVKDRVINKYEKVENLISEMLCDLTCKCSIPGSK